MVALKWHPEIEYMHFSNLLGGVGHAGCKEAFGFGVKGQANGSEKALRMIGAHLDPVPLSLWVPVTHASPHEP